MKTASKRLLLVLSFALCLIGTLVVPVGKASAVSNYDNVIKPTSTDSVTVSNTWSASGGICGLQQPLSQDLTGSWMSVALDGDRYLGSAAGSYNKSGAIAALGSALAAGRGVALIQNYGYSDYASVGGADMRAGDHYLTIYFSDDEALEFDTYSGLNMLTMSGSWYSLSISYVNLSSKCEFGVTQIQHGVGAPSVFVQQGGNNNEKPVFINFDINYPEGYEGIYPLASVKYVAMGDSYSSGEGASGTYLNDGTSCHRSTDSYPRYLADNLPLTPTSFVACSGAVTDDLFSSNIQNPTESAQLDYIGADTDYVTLTIGGNDMGFSEVIRACASSGGGIGYGCSTDTALNASIDNRLDALAGVGTATINSRNIHSISEVLEAINDESPGVKIFIGGYPRLFGSSTANYDYNQSAPGSYECIEFGGGFSYADTQWMNGRADDLNGVINDAVGDAVSLGIDATFVPATLFGGHGHCDSGTSYLNWILVDASANPMPESFHPTSEGQWLGYGLMFEALMD